MTKYRVSWSGVAHRTFAGVPRPSDALYLLWTRHREDIVPGLVTLDAAGATTFPVAFCDEIEAADRLAAVAEFRAMHDVVDVGGHVTVEEVRP